MTTQDTAADNDTQHEPTEAQDIEGELLTELPKEYSFRPATMQERFAAFFTDSLIFIYLLGALAMALKYFTKGDLLNPFSFRGTGAILFGSTGLALHFLYYLFFEGVFLASPGKICAGLSLQKKRGGTPSLFAILVRNLFRLIDYPLVFLTGIGLIEATRRHQRLGDLVAGTVVLREVAFEGKRLPESTPLGGSTRRTIAFLIDLAFWLPFFYGLMLLIPVQSPLISLITLNMVPTLTLLYLAITEAFFQTTIGKALLGLKVVQEDGRPATLATLLVRNLFLLVDANPVGYVCTVLSSRRQRPGDIAAGTIVVTNWKGFRHWLAVPFMILLSGTAAWFGYQNPDSFLRKGYHIKAGKYRFEALPMSVQRLTFRGMRIEKLECGYSEDSANRKCLYDPGHTVYLLMTLSGYTVAKDTAWIQGDLQVRDTHRNIILDRINIINASLPAGKDKSARIVTRFALHPQSLPGPYEATLTLRDLFGNTRLTESQTFTIRK